MFSFFQYFVLFYLTFPVWSKFPYFPLIGKCLLICLGFPGFPVRVGTLELKELSLIICLQIQDFTNFLPAWAAKIAKVMFAQACGTHYVDKGGGYVSNT